MPTSNALSDDRWTKCIAIHGHVTATAIWAPGVVAEARKRHELSPTETVALGEVLLASLLLASTAKGKERVSVSIKGDMMLKQAVADAGPDGKTRGYLIMRDLKGNLDFERGPWQSGFLSVIRQKENQKEPYIGTVPLETGHLAKDLTHYLLQSEQIRSAVGITVKTDESGDVTAAGAFLVQLLPDATDKEASYLEKNITGLASLASELSEDQNPTHLLARVFSDLSFTILDQRPLSFSCQCSRERVLRALLLVGRAELQEMIEKEKGAAVRCDFCSASYAIQATELEQLIGP